MKKDTSEDKNSKEEEQEKTRRCGSVYLGVVVLTECEACYVYEGYVGSAVVLLGFYMGLFLLDVGNRVKLC